MVASIFLHIFASDMEHNGFEYVDLGLSVYWATMNVGANNSLDGGLYFKWGDTIGYTENDVMNKSVDFSSPPFGLESVNIPIPMEKDAANAYMGGNWRMPTEEEIEEFINSVNKCYEIAKLKSDKYKCVYSITINGNEILFPSNGYVDNRTHIQNAMYGTFIWSNSATIGISNAIFAVGMGIMGYKNPTLEKGMYQTIYGHCIRGVLPKD